MVVQQGNRSCPADASAQELCRRRRHSPRWRSPLGCSKGQRFSRQNALHGQETPLRGGPSWAQKAWGEVDSQVLIGRDHDNGLASHCPEWWPGPEGCWGWYGHAGHRAGLETPERAGTMYCASSDRHASGSGTAVPEAYGDAGFWSMFSTFPGFRVGRALQMQWYP